jgi:hypothetical protein
VLDNTFPESDISNDEVEVEKDEYAIGREKEVFNTTRDAAKREDIENGAVPSSEHRKEQKE